MPSRFPSSGATGARAYLARVAAAGFGCLLVSGCASEYLTETGRLKSYEGLTDSNGLVTLAKLRIDKPAVEASRRVSIDRTTILFSSGAAHLTDEERKRVANALDRAICLGLERRFEVVGPGERADLKVHAFVSDVKTTNVAAAGASSVLNVGGLVASAVTHLPVNAPRLPIGLGGLSVEAEALDRRGHQVAAMTWARGADSLTVHARMAEEADAYKLAGEFGSDFARFLVEQESPFGLKGPQVPDAQAVGEYFGAAPKSAACAAFGKNPGAAGEIGAQLGLPPGWTDSGGI